MFNFELAYHLSDSPATLHTTLVWVDIFIIKFVRNLQMTVSLLEGYL